MHSLKDQGRKELEHKLNLMWRREFLRKQSLDAPTVKPMITGCNVPIRPDWGARKGAKFIRVSANSNNNLFPNLLLIPLF
jgi:hypothetical protein